MPQESLSGNIGITGVRVDLVRQSDSVRIDTIESKQVGDQKGYWEFIRPVSGKYDVTFTGGGTTPADNLYGIEVVSNTLIEGVEQFVNDTAPNGSFAAGSTPVGHVNNKLSAQVTIEWGFTQGSEFAHGFIVRWSHGSGSPQTVDDSSPSVKVDSTVRKFSINLPGDDFITFKVYPYFSTKSGSTEGAVYAHANWSDYQPNANPALPAGNLPTGTLIQEGGGNVVQADGVVHTGFTNLKDGKLPDDASKLLENVGDSTARSHSADVRASSANTKAGSALTKATSADALAQTAKQDALLADNKADSAIVKAGSADVRSQSADVKAGSASVKAGSADVRSQTAKARADTAIQDASDAFIKAGSADVRSQSASIKAGSADVRSQSADAIASTAKQDALLADQKAGSAQVTANTAKQAAADADTAAGVADGKAVAAQGDATQAISDASDADDKASSALVKSGSADAKANSALTRAISAGGEAALALDTATSAESRAKSGEAKATTAKQDALLADQKAGSADVKAGSSLIAVKTAYAQANTARIIATSAVNSAKTAKQAATLADQKAGSALIKAASADVRAGSAGSQASSALSRANTAVQDAALADNKADSAIVKAGSALIKAGSSDVRSQSADARSATADANAVSAQNSSKTALAKANTANTNATSAQNVAKSADAKAGSASVKAGSADIRSQSADVRSLSADAIASTAKQDALLADNKAGSAQVSANTAYAKAKTSGQDAALADQKAKLAQASANTAKQAATLADNKASSANARAASVENKAKGLDATGSFVGAGSGNQRIEIDYVNGRLHFYDASDNELIKIGENVIGSWEGILFGYTNTVIGWNTGLLGAAGSDLYAHHTENTAGTEAYLYWASSTGTINLFSDGIGFGTVDSNIYLKNLSGVLKSEADFHILGDDLYIGASTTGYGKIYMGSDILWIYNQYHGTGIVMWAHNASGLNRYGLTFDPDNSVNLYYDGDIAVRTMADGIYLGDATDTNLYRSAANILSTDDHFIAGGNIKTLNNFQSSDGTNGANLTKYFTDLNSDEWVVVVKDGLVTTFEIL